MARNRTLLQTPQSFALKQLVQYDPFNLAPIFLSKFAVGGRRIQIDASSGYYLSADHTMLLILAKPKRPAQDVPFGEETARRGRRSSRQRALANFQKNAAPERRCRTSSTPAATRSRSATPISSAGRHHQRPRHRSSASWRCSSTRSAVRVAILYGALPMALGLLMTFGIAGAGVRPALVRERRLRRAAGRPRHRLHHRALRPLRRRAQPRRDDAARHRHRDRAPRFPASSSRRSRPRRRSTRSWPPTSAG